MVELLLILTPFALIDSISIVPLSLVPQRSNLELKRKSGTETGGDELQQELDDSENDRHDAAPRRVLQ